MFVRLAVLLLGAIAATVIVWFVYMRVVVASLRRSRIERIERENADLDRIINADRPRSRMEV